MKIFSNEMKAFKTLKWAQNGFEMKLISSIRNSTTLKDTNKEAMEELPETSTSVPSLLLKPLLPLHKFLTIIGVGPHSFNNSKKAFEIRWRSPDAIHSILTCVYMTGLMTITALCIIFAFISDEVVPRDDDNVRSIKFIGFFIMVGYQLNAWVQVLNAVFSGPTRCRLLNDWNEIASSTEIDPTKGVYMKSLMQVGFMVLFVIAMMIATVVGRPTFVPHVLDTVAVDMYLIPRDWISPWIVSRKIVHMIVVVVCLHQFAINKGTVFAFTTHCHLLKTSFLAWNGLLSQALEDIWEKGEQNCLSDLVKSRRKLVQMVRCTEKIFSPILQCYFATTVVIVCTELYLLAQRMRSENSEVDELVILVLLTLQTTSLLVHVSLAAGAVEEEAEASADVLMRGLPMSASDVDKFYMGELTRTISCVSVYITGGNFYTINKPFILTVVSVVASYFIVILQFMHSCNKENEPAFSNATETLSNFTLQP